MPGAIGGVSVLASRVDGDLRLVPADGFSHSQGSVALVVRLEHPVHRVTVAGPLNQTDDVFGGWSGTSKDDASGKHTTSLNPEGDMTRPLPHRSIIEWPQG